MSEDQSQSETTGSAEVGFSQGDVDAVLNSAPERSDNAGAISEPGSEGEVDTSVSQDDIDALISAANDPSATPGAMEEGPSASDATAAAPPPPPPAEARLPDLPAFDGAGPEVDPKRVTMLNDVKLRVKIELGRTRMLVEDVLKLGEGSVVELDKLAGDPVDVYVNDRLVARGEVLVLNDNFCVRISDVISNDPHRISA